MVSSPGVDFISRNHVFPSSVTSNFSSIKVFFFFNVDHFWSLCWICYNVASVLFFGFLAARHVGSQLPDQESKPHTPHIGRWLPLDLQLFLLFSGSVVSHCLQLHGLQHTRLPCPSVSSRVCSNSCPLSQWCHPAISSSDALFSFCSQ